MTVDARLEIRLSSESKALLEEAARLVGQPVSKFVRSVVEDRIAEVIQEHQTTTLVSPEYFAQLMASLDEPPRPNSKLAEGSRKLDQIVLPE